VGSPGPAKSVRKLTTPTVVSKKFWVARVNEFDGWSRLLFRA
jgi:hypothetical protein